MCQRLRRRRCSGLHKHHVLEGSFQTQQAAKYTNGFVDAILRGLQKSFQKEGNSRSDVASYHVEQGKEVLSPLDKDVRKLGQMVADPVNKVISDYVCKMEQMDRDLDMGKSK